MKNEVTKQIRVYGIVQGVGFRPTVSRHAATHQIRGSVSNKGPYVEIFAQGPEEAVDGFISDIENKPPKRAAILKMNIEPVEEACRMGIAALSYRVRKKPEYLPARPAPALACKRCGSVKHLHNADGAQNAFCGQCGQAIDWTDAAETDA